MYKSEWLIHVIILLFPLVVNAGPMIITDDFDNGSILHSKISLSYADSSKPNMDLESRRVADCRWIHFRATGVKNRIPSFKLLMNYSGVGAHNNGHKYLYSYDKKTFTFMDNGKITGSYYYFSNDSAFTKDTVYIAYSYPFPYSRTVEQIEKIKSSKWVFPTNSSDSNLIYDKSLGTEKGNYPSTSEPGRFVPPLNYYGFKITDTSSVEDKKYVLLMSGNHSSEVTGQYVLEGLLDFLLSTDANATALRKKMVFYV